MTELSTEQLLYLLYTFAYSQERTVTKGTVKSYLSKKDCQNTVEICDSLCNLNLIESPKRGRISITEMGIKILIINLQKTEYKFTSIKGPKILNALIYCLKLASKYSQTEQNVENKDMDFETFVEKFKKLYLEERQRQELQGVVAIRSQEICQKFLENYHISEPQLEKYFEQLKSNDLVFAVRENNKELIQWVE